MEPQLSQEDLARSLQAQAATLWGVQRAEALRASLEAAARQVLEIGRSLPRPGTEPGVYPPLHQ
jgi:hypothetical protein